jgi:hypothetical protein
LEQAVIGSTGVELPVLIGSSRDRAAHRFVTVNIRNKHVDGICWRRRRVPALVSRAGITGFRESATKSRGPTLINGPKNARAFVFTVRVFLAHEKVESEICRVRGLRGAWLKALEDENRRLKKLLAESLGLGVILF